MNVRERTKKVEERKKHEEKEREWRGYTDMKKRGGSVKRTGRKNEGRWGKGEGRKEEEGTERERRKKKREQREKREEGKEGPEGKLCKEAKKRG